MRNQVKNWGVTLLLTFSLLPILSAQQKIDETLIKQSFDNVAIGSILDQLGQAYSFDVYRDDGTIFNTKVSHSFEDQTLGSAIDKLLFGTSYDYVVYRDYAIMILPKRIANEVYSSDYYQALESSLDEGAETEGPKTMVVGDITKLNPSGTAKVKGIIVDANDKEPIIGATVYWKGIEVGAATGAFGDYETSIPAGTHDILIQYVGYSDMVKTITVYSDGELNFEINRAAVNLQEIIVSGEAIDANVENVQIGVERLDVKDIKKTPTFMGEADVIKTLLLNPGVSSVGEAASGFNVRGGNVDQNLILQDEAFIFNSSHSLGILSTFNADLLRSVKLYKGNIPAQFGGRLVSVMEVEMRDGNFEEYKIKAGIGPVTGKLSFEGPIVKEKTSFIVGLRSSYTDWFLNLLKVEELKNSSSFFFDGNARLTHKFNKNNSLVLSGYYSTDDFNYNNDFGFDYSTIIGQLIFKSIFNEKAYNKFTINTSKYASTQTDFAGTDASVLDNSISYIKAKEQFTLNPTNALKLDMGVAGVLYMTEPGERVAFGDDSTISPKTLEEERGLEVGLFVNAEYELSDRFLISAGLRANGYQYLGGGTFNEYANPDQPELDEVIGQKTYGDGDVIFSDYYLEPRVSMRLRLDENSSIKAGYSRTSQVLNQVFNSDSPTPTSQWQLSNQYVPINKAHNVSLGYFRNYKDNIWESSFEIYGRTVDELFDYKDFADLVVNENIETELLDGIGRAYGFELSLKKKKGIVNGSLSYTLARTERQIAGINDGEWYPSNFDKPHDLSLVVNVNPNKRNTLTLNFTYATGRPTSPPIGNFTTTNNLLIPIYTDRNQLRIPDYHRMDIAYTVGKGYKKDKKFQTSWTISLYNVYARRNAFSVFFTRGQGQKAQANRLAVFGSVFPALTFNFEIL